VIQGNQNSSSGEFSRDISENCYTHNIDANTELAKFLEVGSAEGTMRVVPTMIEFSVDEQMQRFVVFHHDGNLHFYS